MSYFHGSLKAYRNKWKLLNWKVSGSLVLNVNRSAKKFSKKKDMPQDSFHQLKTKTNKLLENNTITWISDSIWEGKDFSNINIYSLCNSKERKGIEKNSHYATHGLECSIFQTNTKDLCFSLSHPISSPQAVHCYWMMWQEMWHPRFKKWGQKILREVLISERSEYEKKNHQHI